MGSLTEKFKSLRLENGEPDTEKRKLEICQLIRSMSASEIRHIRVLLQPLPTCNDICVEFPLEVITCIAEHLKLEDVPGLSCVSRKWRDTFSSIGMCRMMIQKYFPNHWQQNYHALKAGQPPSNGECMRSWFRSAATRRINIQNGRFHSTAAYWFSAFKGDVGDFEEYQYCSGRVAVRYMPSAISVRGLRLGSIDRNIMDEHRSRIDEWLLSDRYLIGVRSSPTTMLAWDLESDRYGEPDHIRLPNRVSNFLVRDGCVAIVTLTHEILIWRIGAGLTSLGFATRDNLDYQSIQYPRERFYSDCDPIETFPCAGADGGIKYELYYPPVPRTLDSYTRLHYMWNVDEYPDEFFNNSARKIVADDNFVVLLGRCGFVVWSFDENVVLSKESLWEEGSTLAHRYHPLMLPLDDDDDSLMEL